MCIEICEQCLIKVICTDPCEDFKLPDGREIFYYLETTVKFDRLRQYHKNKKIMKKYYLSTTETAVIGMSGYVFWDDLDRNSNRSPYEIFSKYIKMMGE